MWRNRRGGGVDTSTPAPTLHLEPISAGDTTLSISADEPITRAVADNAALLAGITVHYAPFEGTRGTDNIATAAIITNNAIAITISRTAAEGDEFFVQLAAGLVQNTAGTANIALTGDEELNYKIAVNPFMVKDLPRDNNVLASDFIPDNYRAHFVTFRIRTGVAEAGEYRLALKASSADAPSTSELVAASAAITRTLSSEVINIYLPFHMEGTYFDTGATQNYDTAKATVLSPATTYTLYATKADGTGDVLNITDFTTDALPTAGTVPSKLFYGQPSSSYTYTIREAEPSLFIVEFQNYGGNLTVRSVNLNGDEVIITDCGFATCSDNNDDYQVFLSNPLQTFILLSSVNKFWAIFSNGDIITSVAPFRFQEVP